MNVILCISCFLFTMLQYAMAGPGGPHGGMVRLAREERRGASGAEVVRALLSAGVLDAVRPSDLIALLDTLAQGQVMQALEPVDGTSLLSGVERLRSSQRSHGGKRTLDTLGGMAFGGQKKRFDSLSGSTFGLSKRDFDEIDNVGFTGFARRRRSPPRGSMLALAKKNLDEIDNVGFLGFSKRNFDEIDHAGFDSFAKREPRN